MTEITVVIPNYKGEKYLKNCVDSVFKSTKLNLNVIIVDNGSEDRSIEEIRGKYPEIRCICLDRNYGFCRAVNVGIREADTPFVFLLNNDTLVCDGAIDALLQTIKCNDKVFSVEAKMIQYHERNKIDSAGTFYNALGWAYARGKDKNVHGYARKTESFAACGGAALYRKRIFEEIGLFDEKHFAYLEDIDIGYRARLHGYTNFYEPAARILHVGSASSGSRHNAFKVRLSSRNNLYLLYKNMPAIQIMLNLPFLITGFIIKYLFFLKKGLGHEYLAGLRDGIKVCAAGSEKSICKKNGKNYIRIQIELWKNIFRMIW